MGATRSLACGRHPELSLWAPPGAYRSRTRFAYNLPVTRTPKESMDQFRTRVKHLEKPSRTSPMYGRVGWPLLLIGLLIWLVTFLIPGTPFLVSILALVLSGAGGAAIALSFVSAHSEGVEGTERERCIRERSVVSRCLYLEGKVPDGRGIVGRCRLYEFDMVDLPYCLYCREYKPSKGKPEV